MRYDLIWYLKETFELAPKRSGEIYIQERRKIAAILAWKRHSLFGRA